MSVHRPLHAVLACLSVAMIFGFVASVRAAEPVSVPTPSVMPSGAELRPTTRRSSGSGVGKVSLVDFHRLALSPTGGSPVDPTLGSPATSISLGTAEFLPPGVAPVYADVLLQLTITRTAPGATTYTLDLDRFDITFPTVAGYRMRSRPEILYQRNAGTLALIPDATTGGYLMDLEFNTYFDYSEDGGETWTPTSGFTTFRLTAVPEPTAALALGVPALLLRRRSR